MFRVLRQVLVVLVQLFPRVEPFLNLFVTLLLSFGAPKLSPPTRKQKIIKHRRLQRRFTFVSSIGPRVTLKPRKQLRVFVENLNLRRTLNKQETDTVKFAKTVRTKHSIGDKNTNKNLTGLATLARKEANVRFVTVFVIVPSSLPPVVVITVKVVFGRLNTTTGKNLATKTFVDGLPVTNCYKLFPTILLVVPANLLNLN